MSEAMRLDQVEQRVLGVLLEKELAVPENYPLTESALLAGCNQKSNRDPFMEVEEEELSAALMQLSEKQLVLRVSQAGSRAIRYRHLAEDALQLNGREKAVMAELLIRGAQAPGALKPRVARMGMMASPAEILAVLEGLASRTPSLVVRQPRRPRERDHRWQHRLAETASADVSVVEACEDVMPAESPSPAPSAVAAPEASDLARRVEDLEEQVRMLRAELDTLKGH